MEKNIPLKKVLDIIEMHLGSNTEVVYHDLTLPYDQTIVDIRNGKITGRTIGGCGSNLGLEIIRGTIKDGDRFNYITHTNTGKILRSSTIYIHENEEIVGALCINTDITETVKFETMLSQYNMYSPETQHEEGPSEFFANNVNELLEFFMQEAQKLVGVPAPMMSKDDRLLFLSYLDNKGAFLITKSGEHVCQYLGISKYTLYSLLEEIRARANN